MEKIINMDQEKILEIIKDYKNKSNKDLVSVLDFLYEDFNKTKDLIIKLTHHLDSTEISYNKLLEEINNRTKNE
jgi:sulfite reductase alpha subunit-like flavoprotein